MECTTKTASTLSSIWSKLHNDVRRKMWSVEPVLGETLSYTAPPGSIRRYVPQGKGINSMQPLKRIRRPSPMWLDTSADWHVGGKSHCSDYSSSLFPASYSWAGLVCSCHCTSYYFQTALVWGMQEQKVTWSLFQNPPLCSLHKVQHSLALYFPNNCLVKSLPDCGWEGKSLL